MTRMAGLGLSRPLLTFLWDNPMAPSRTFVVVPHTHWDREWYLPFEAFRARLVRMMDALLDLLDRDPEYKHFVLDGQTTPPPPSRPCGRCWSRSPPPATSSSPTAPTTSRPTRGSPRSSAPPTSCWTTPRWCTAATRCWRGRASGGAAG